MAKKPEPAAKMMRPDASLHADQAGRHIGEACFHLPTRPLLPERDCPTSIQADDVEGVLADIDADHGDHTLQVSAMACSFPLAPPASLRADRGRSTAGPSH